MPRKIRFFCCDKESEKDNKDFAIFHFLGKVISADAEEEKAENNMMI